VTTSNLIIRTKKATRIDMANLLRGPFVYENLSYDSSGQSLQIRVLDLLPGSKTDIIRCGLRAIAINHDTPYEALSYTWGTPDRCHQVDCGASYLCITSTLQEALVTLRHPSQKRTLWIDQLCINQEDVSERNAQVKVMHLVYKHARRTIVFLSASGPGEEPKPNVQRRKLYHELRRGHKIRGGDAMQDLQELFAHAWFRRVWILQEVSMSNTLKIIVYYKGHGITWERLSRAANWFHQYVPGQKVGLFQFPPSVRQHEIIVSTWTAMISSQASFFSCLQRYGDLTNKYNEWAYSRFFLWLEPRLTEVLQDSRFCLATDPRDKVYSLLNLVSASSAKPELAWLLKVDYSLPVAEVYLRAARYTIETEHSLEILCYKEDAPNITDLPSWTPDWTSQRLFPVQRISNPLHYRSQFHSAISSSRSWLPPSREISNKTPVASFSDDGKVMTLRGYRLDTIEVTSAIWDSPLAILDEERFEEWASIFTGGSHSEVTTLPFKRDRWPKGIRIHPQTIGDFWLRVARSPRLMTTDAISPVQSAHATQEQWRRGRGRGPNAYLFSRQGNLSLLWAKDWLSTTLPYASLGRRVAATRTGYFLLVPPDTKTGDVVYFLEGGGSLGYVLRPNDGAIEFFFVGAAYVHGFYGIKRCWEGMAPVTVVLR
jgi:hypothetical protein